MKKILISLVLGLILNNNAFADDEVRIATIDLEKIQSSSLVVNDVVKQIKAKEKEIQDKMSKEQKDLISKHKEIQEKQSVMSQEILKKKIDALQKQEQSMQEKMRLNGYVMESARMEVLQKIIPNYIRSATAKVAKKEYDIVMPVNSVFFVSSNIEDITPDVLSKLNDDFKKFDSFSKIFDEIFKQVSDNK